MVRVSTINLTSVPENIRKEPFFLACVAESHPAPLKSLSSQLNVDHVALYQCEEKTLSFLNGWKHLGQHEKFPELSQYTSQVKGAEFNSPQNALLFYQAAIGLLERGASLDESTTRAAELLGRNVEFHKPLHVVMKLEEKVPEKVEEEKKQDPTLISSLQARAISISRFEKGLRCLGRQEMKNFQGNCIYVLEKYLKKQGMDPEQAKQEALDILGRDYGIDGKYGRHTRKLSAMVATILVEEGRIELSQIKDARDLSKNITSILLMDATELAIRQLEE